MSFDKWVTHIFDHSVTDPAWHWGDDVEYWDCTADTMVEYMTQLFEHAADILLPFSDAQVNQSLWYLASNSCSDYMFSLRDEPVSLTSKLKCIQSMETLFESCFAKRCSPHLAHSDLPGTNPLNSICYMWWDVIPIHGLAYHEPLRSDSVPIDEAFLDVIQKVMNMDSIACQESGMHGLGEWCGYYKEINNAAISKFLNRYRWRYFKKVPRELREYAAMAMVGCV